jgi:hypothetical protein
VNTEDNAGSNLAVGGAVSRELPEREVVWSSMLGIRADDPNPVKRAYGELSNCVGRTSYLQQTQRYMGWKAKE